MAKTLDEILGDVFDSREIIERIDELERYADEDDDGNYTFEDEDEREEYANLKEIEEECSGYSDWEYGVTFIADSYFQEYAEQLAEDIGAIDRDAGWPLMHIDWEAAADALRMDYTSVEIQGVEYWYR